MSSASLWGSVCAVRIKLSPGNSFTPGIRVYSVKLCHSHLHFCHIRDTDGQECWRDAKVPDEKPRSQFRRETTSSTIERVKPKKPAPMLTAHSEAGLLSSSIAIERHRAAHEDAAALLATPRDLDPWTQSLRPADLLSLAAEDGIQPAPPGLPWIHTVTRTWAGPAPSSHLTLFPNSHLVRRLCGGAENCRNLSGISYDMNAVPAVAKTQDGAVTVPYTTCARVAAVQRHRSSRSFAALRGARRASFRNTICTTQKSAHKRVRGARAQPSHRLAWLAAPAAPCISRG